MTAADEALEFERPGRFDPMVAGARAANVGAALELERRAPDGVRRRDDLERRLERLEAAIADLARVVDEIPDPVPQETTRHDCVADRLVALLEEAGLVEVLLTGAIVLRGQGGLLDRLEDGELLGAHALERAEAS